MASPRLPPSDAPGNPSAPPPAKVGRQDDDDMVTEEDRQQYGDTPGLIDGEDPFPEVPPKPKDPTLGPYTAAKSAGLEKAGEGVPLERLRYLVRFSDVEPEEVRWAWAGRIPLGMLSILDGNPKTGKSLVTIDLAARVTTGRPMPDGTAGPVGAVVLLNAEDSPSRTIVPRLLAAGADRRYVVSLPLVDDRKTYLPAPPTVPADLDAVEGAIRREGAVLVIIDPLTAYLGGECDSYKDQHVRRALAPLATLADQTGAAIVCVRHLNKRSGDSAIYRGGGSIAFTGAARSVLLAAKDPDDPQDGRILAMTACNLAPEAPSLRYRVTGPVGRPRIEWGGPCDITADALTSAPASADERSELDAAMDFLRGELELGERLAKDITSAARTAGIAARTLERARARLGIKARRIGGLAEAGRWVLDLPDDPPSGAKAATRARGGLSNEPAETVPEPPMDTRGAAAPSKAAMLRPSTAMTALAKAPIDDDCPGGF